MVHAGRFWDGTWSEVREDIDVVVRDGRIAEVAPHRTGRPAARRVDASDRTVVPGLWDAHTHPWHTTYGGRHAALQVAYGITTAVSLGGFAYEQARIREAVAAGVLVGPRLLTTELLDWPRVAYSMGRAHRTREGLRHSLVRGAALCRPRSGRSSGTRPPSRAAPSRTSRRSTPAPTSTWSRPRSRQGPCSAPTPRSRTILA